VLCSWRPEPAPPRQRGAGEVYVVGQGSLIIGGADDKHGELGIVLEQLGPGDPSRQEDPLWACQSRPLERSSPLAFQVRILLGRLFDSQSIRPRLQKKFVQRRAITWAGEMSQAEARALHGGALGDDEGDIVVLFVGAEEPDFVDDGCEQGLRREGAVAAQGSDQAIFSKFFAGIVEGFGDAVGVERKGVTGKELALSDLAVPLLEDAENRGGGFEPV
jgi:hypothetical protein